MPKLQIFESNKLVKFVNEFKGVFRSDGKVLLCLLCTQAISAERQSQVTQHNVTVKHQGYVAKKLKIAADADKAWQGILQESLNQLMLRNNFILDLCRILMACGIPLHNLRNPLFQLFLEKYTNTTVPSESTIW